MSIKGYEDYKRREFCNDVQCFIQLELNSQEQESEKYEKTRNLCKSNCKYTTYQFHHWLMNKGYLIVRPEISKNNIAKNTM